LLVAEEREEGLRYESLMFPFLDRRSLPDRLFVESSDVFFVRSESNVPQLHGSLPPKL
jgi:hypothetical protein